MARLTVIERDGAYEVNKKTGTTQLHPASKRLDALRRDYVKVLSLLGLRAAVAVKGDEPGRVRRGIERQGLGVRSNHGLKAWYARGNRRFFLGALNAGKFANLVIFVEFHTHEFR